MVEYMLTNDLTISNGMLLRANVYIYVHMIALKMQ